MFVVLLYFLVIFSSSFFFFFSINRKLFIVEILRQSRHVDDDDFSVLFLIARFDFQSAICTVHHDQFATSPLSSPLTTMTSSPLSGTTNSTFSSATVSARAPREIFSKCSTPDLTLEMPGWTSNAEPPTPWNSLHDTLRAVHELHDRTR